MKLRCLPGVVCLLGLSLVGCEGDGSSPDHAEPDSGSEDAGSRDAGDELDAGADLDSSSADAQLADGAVEDASAGDGSAPDAGTDAASARWFEANVALQLKLSGKLGDAFSAAFAGTPDGIIPPDRKKDPFPGSSSYAFRDSSPHTLGVELAVRGNSSLQECAFPKLKLAFQTRSDQPNDVFFDTKKIKIGTHCGEELTVNGTIGRLRNQSATWREELVYQLARALGITIMQTRLALIEYTDSSAQPAFEGPLLRKAFLLEHIDELARRLGATALKDPTNCGDDPAARPNHQDVLRVKFFHAMIGNWDWQLGPPESDGCGDIMNTEVLVHPDGSLTLVPADFDLAAFVVGRVRNPDNNKLEAVTADNAKASARHYLASSLQGEAAGAVNAMKAEYRAKHTQLRALIDLSALDEEGRVAARLLVDGFMAVLAE